MTNEEITNDEELSELDRAERIVKAMEVENNRKEELLIKEEKIKAIDMVSGKSEATIEPEKPKEESPQEYMDKVMSGGLTPENEKE